MYALYIHAYWYILFNQVCYLTQCHALLIHVGLCIRFMVRDFEYDPKEVQAESVERGKLELQLKNLFVCYYISLAYTIRTSRPH